MIAIAILIIGIAGIFIYERLHASLYVDEEVTSFSVIGGADDSTAIFIVEHKEKYDFDDILKGCNEYAADKIAEFIMKEMGEACLG